MFGKNKVSQEELEKLKNAVAIDDKFFADMEGGKDMFEATVSELGESCRQAEAEVAQVRENMHAAEALAADNVRIEGDLVFAIGDYRNVLAEAKERQAVVSGEVRNIVKRITELVDENKHFTTPSKVVSEFSAGAESRTEALSHNLDRMEEYGKQMGVLALNAAIEAGRLGDAGKQFVSAAEDVRSYAANYDQVIEDSRRQLEESKKRVSELEEQAHRLVTLLRENNMSIAKLMKVCAEVAEHADALGGCFEMERLTEIGHQVTTLRNADEEIVKSEQRNRMQIEDLTAELAAQKKHQKEIQQMVDPVYRHVVERKAGRE